MWSVADAVQEPRRDRTGLNLMMLTRLEGDGLHDVAVLALLDDEI